MHKRIIRKKNTAFEYISNQLVLKFEENTDGVTVTAVNVQTKEKQLFRAKKLVLAAGVLGTARIVLRSLNQFDKKIPLLCNEYRYAPCIQWSRLGKTDEEPRHSFAQLAMFHDPDGKNTDVAMASLYSYGSLMLFRLIKEVPLNLRASSALMRYLSPAITILGIHLPDHSTDKKNLSLIKSDNPWSGDTLHAEFSLSDKEKKAVKNRLKKFRSAMENLNCTLLKTLDPGAGSSIHYAGSLPFSPTEKPLHLEPRGRLWQTSNIYVADSSGFAYLPAKGITFSLMANAHNVAQHASSDLKNGQ